MPINLKKSDIENAMDNPKEGYVILGFDQTGRLVSKDSDGNYLPIVPVIPTGDFQDLNAEYFTVGYRLTTSSKGLYSIGQGINVIASGESSYAQGVNASAGSDYSTAKGVNVSASGLYSYVNGEGESSVNSLISGGKNSFVHSFANMSSGTLSDYSVILGGINHYIGSGADNSVIIGGTTNTISTSITNVAIIACNTLTATVSNAVYIPKLIFPRDTSTTTKTISVEDPTGLNQVGGNLIIVSGKGSTGSGTAGTAGGNIIISGGTGGSNSSAGAGGDIYIIGGGKGSGSSTTGDGGSVYIYGGQGGSSNGDIYFGTGTVGRLRQASTIYHVYYDPSTGLLSYN